MPQIIKVGGGFFSSSELLRINPQTNTLEVSNNDGRSWTTRCADRISYGVFEDLLFYKKEVLAATSKGLYASTNGGRSFSPRCISSSYGDFLSLQCDGNYLIAQTTRGLYYSTNDGRGWVRR